MQFLRDKLRPYIYHLLFVVVSLLIFVTNYEPGTILSGWDNLQTELNPFLAVKRAWFSVWQEYQSLGLLSGLAHASDLIRAVFMWGVSFILPMEMERMFFMVLMVFIGGIGMFFFLNHSEIKGMKTSYAFLGGLYYILNIGTIQLISLPLEAFSIFFAAFPWQIWIFYEMVRDKSDIRFGKRLFLFFLINLLATPAYYIQTDFVVYMMILGAMTTGLLFSKKFFTRGTKAFMCAVMIVIMNLFWLAPQVYFLQQSGSVVKEAKSNTLSTDDLFYQNREKGTPESFVTLKGFYFDLNSPNRGELFGEWKNHLNQPVVQIAQFLILLMVGIGLLRFTRYHLPFLFALAIIAIALMPVTPPFSIINEFLRQDNTLNQIFRAPFTKFIVPYAFIASFLFANGIVFVGGFLHKKIKHFDPQPTIAVVVCVTIFIFALPAFRGQYFNSEMRVKLPGEYLELAKFFENADKNKRVALLPDYTFWGWFITRWGYNGSGFLWYAIEQPVVSRTFDVWSDKSESYFWEIKAAADAEDVVRFESVLEKYDIDYLVLDYSLLPVSASIKGLQYGRIESLLKESDNITLAKKWKNLAVYQVKREMPTKNFVSIARDLPNIGPPIKLTNDDTGFRNQGSYITDETALYDYYYPFLDITTQTRLPNKKWTLEEKDKSFELTRKLDSSIKNNLNSYRMEAATVSAAFTYLTATSEAATFTSTIGANLKAESLQVSVDKYPVDSFKLSDAQFVSCGLNQGVRRTQISKGVLSIYTDGGAGICFQFTSFDLEQQYGYILDVKSHNVKGRPLHLYALDRTKEQSFVEDRLYQDRTLMIINPKFLSGVGYNWTFHNTSYENVPASNRIDAINVYYFPYQDIKEIVLERRGSENLTPSTFYTDFQTKKINYFTYEVTLPKIEDNSTLILKQSFEDGWIASINGKPLTKHVLVNNWSNGWKIGAADSGKKVTIVFRPQYLQYYGLIILGLLVLGFSGYYLHERYYHKKKHHPHPSHSK